MNPMPIGKIFQIYISMFNHCGEFLLNFSDEKIGTYIFEEFDIEATTFLHENTLDKLKSAEFIDEAEYNCSKNLRQKFLKLQGTDLWNVESVKTTLEWREIMRLADEIRTSINDKWSDDELKYLYKNE